MPSRDAPGVRSPECPSTTESYQKRFPLLLIGRVDTSWRGSSSGHEGAGARCDSGSTAGRLVGLLAGRTVPFLRLHESGWYERFFPEAGKEYLVNRRRAILGNTWVMLPKLAFPTRLTWARPFIIRRMVIEWHSPCTRCSRPRISARGPEVLQVHRTWRPPSRGTVRLLLLSPSPFQEPSYATFHRVPFH